MKQKSDAALIIWFVLIFWIGVLTAVYTGKRGMNNEDEKCRRRGGVPLRTAERMVCVDSNAVMK